MRFYGEVGYGTSVVDPPGSGVVVEQITEVPYFGDVNRNASQSVEGESVNNDISIDALISIVADPNTPIHFSKIKYVRWAGRPWTVTSVEVRTPRLILSLGTVYNGPTA